MRGRGGTQVNMKCPANNFTEQMSDIPRPVFPVFARVWVENSWVSALEQGFRAGLRVSSTPRMVIRASQAHPPIRQMAVHSEMRIPLAQMEPRDDSGRRRFSLQRTPLVRPQIHNMILNSS